MYTIIDLGFLLKLIFYALKQNRLTCISLACSYVWAEVQVGDYHPWVTKAQD